MSSELGYTCCSVLSFGLLFSLQLKIHIVILLMMNTCTWKGLLPTFYSSCSGLPLDKPKKPAIAWNVKLVPGKPENNLKCVKAQCFVIKCFKFFNLYLLLIKDVSNHQIKLLNFWIVHSLLFIFFVYLFIFYLGFPSWTFWNHRTAEKGSWYFVNSTPPLLPTSQTLRH